MAIVPERLAELAGRKIITGKCPQAPYEAEWMAVDRTPGIKEKMAERMTPQYRRYAGPA